MNGDLILSSEHVVLEDSVGPATVAVRDGSIVSVEPGRSSAADVIDLGEDFLLPGLVELHTDHLEGQVHPRPKVLWPRVAAVVSHDAQIAACGITTVFDALRIGSNVKDHLAVARSVKPLVEAIDKARDGGALRVDHLLHLRCELACEDTVETLESFLGEESLRLISLMDHTPGQRQFTSMETYRYFYKDKTGMTDVQLDAFIAERLDMHHQWADRNRRAIVALAHEHGLAIASHDDALEDHVDEAVEQGVSIAEFPTTLEAAATSHGHGLSVLMGAPNVVRGGSHSGNISAQSLAEAGYLDILSSDYVPYSLIQATFLLPELIPTLDLATAVRMVTKTPARAAGLEDRGVLAPGQRGDLVQVVLAAGLPTVRAVWREGRRVA